MSGGYTIVEEGRKWSESEPAGPADRYVRWTHQISSTTTLAVSGTVGGTRLDWRWWKSKGLASGKGRVKDVKVSRDNPHANLRAAYMAALPSLRLFES